MTGLIILFMIGIVVGPICVAYLPKEIAYWQMAAAEEMRLDGRLEEAILYLSRAIDKCPNDSTLWRQRAQWRMEARQFEQALLDADRAVALAPGSAEGYMVRSQIYQHLGRHAQAVKDWSWLVEATRQRKGAEHASALNGRSYARALGGLELEEAKKDIEAALSIVGPNAAMLDTRGYLRYRRGEYAAARADMEKAVALAEGEFQLYSRGAEKLRLGTADPRLLELELSRHAQATAVIRYHRALVYDRLGMQDRAEEDRRRVRQLGFEPNDSLF